QVGHQSPQGKAERSEDSRLGCQLWPWIGGTPVFRQLWPWTGGTPVFCHFARWDPKAETYFGKRMGLRPKTRSESKIRGQRPRLQLRPAGSALSPGNLRLILRKLSRAGNRLYSLVL